VDPRTLSGGYRYKGPGDADKADPTKWEVSTYRWEPGFMQVLQGDKVTLVGFIVNGDKHTVWVEDPSGERVVTEQEWNRGREYRFSFVAEKLGYYQLHCHEHDPTMAAHILVLPR
jgi:plastocyanin